MPKRTLRVIPEPAQGSRVVLVNAPTGIYFTGKGTLDLLCGGCGKKLAKSLPLGGAPQNVVMQCTHCRAYNDTEPAPN